MCSRLQWSLESMNEAFKAVKIDGKGLRQAAREYDVPVTTLKRRVDGEVAVDAKPGPRTVLTKEEEKKLCKYCFDMCDMGYGLTVEDVKIKAYEIMENSGRQHPFREGKAGRDWYEGFLRRFPHISLRREEALSYMRAKNANDKVIEDFFAKLAAVLARLNLLSKPMHIYNADETGFSKVHKSRRKVLARRGQKTVWGITSGERGRTHTLLVCASASGHAIPPLIIFPRVRLPCSLKVGAPPGTMFATSKKGWINQDIFSSWLDFFIKCVPSERPVLLIYDGHASHLSIEVIEKARANEIHFLCLPSHCTHLLQPLDVGVMSSLKAHFGNACKHFLVKNPGRIITEDDLASLMGQAWPLALTPGNIMGGFCKSGVFPLNPGRITDRHKAPSVIYSGDQSVDASSLSSSSKSGPSPGSSQQSVVSVPSVSSPSLQDSSTKSVDDLFILPKPKSVSKRTRTGLTTTAQCTTESPFLKRLQEKKAMREEKSQKKTAKKTKKKPKSKPKPKPRIRSPKKAYNVRKKTAAARLIAQIQQSKEIQDSDATVSSEDDEVPCGVCGVMYGTDDKVWIQCSECGLWFHITCVEISKKSIPDVFLCPDCD